MGYQPTQIKVDNFDKIASSSIIMPYSTIESNVATMDNLTAKFSDETYDLIFKKLSEKFNVKPTFEHKCHNCGGTLIMNTEQHIFNCPYCDSVYAIGTAMINDKGDREWI